MYVHTLKQINTHTYMYTQKRVYLLHYSNALLHTAMFEYLQQEECPSTNGAHCTVLLQRFLRACVSVAWGSDACAQVSRQASAVKNLKLIKAAVHFPVDTGAAVNADLDAAWKPTHPTCNLLCWLKPLFIWRTVSWVCLCSFQCLCWLACARVCLCHWSARVARC